jgi:hypothetical protein
MPQDQMGDSHIKPLGERSTALLEAIREFISQLSREPANTVLELRGKHEAARKLETAERIELSLDQYLRKEAQLFYVGLVGIFSAGKSSLINALLSLDSTVHARKTDLHPTDTGLTLITHPKNENYLYPMLRQQTGKVNVRPYFIESSWLEDVVLVDSPGSGDQPFFEEMVQDFLPVCDLLLYLIPSTHPLDKAEIPLFDLLLSRLHFIPIKIVISRANEFAVPGGGKDSLDADKLAAFRSRFVSRLREYLHRASLGQDRIKEEDLTFVDSPTGLNVEELRNEIFLHKDALSIDDRTTAHLNRLAFYDTSFGQIHSYFREIAAQKQRHAHSFVEGSREKIERYDEVVSLVDRQMPPAWILFVDDLRQRQKDLIERSRPTSTVYQATLWAEAPRTGFRATLDGAIARAVENAVSAVTGAIQTDVQTQLMDYCSKFIAEFSQEPASLARNLPSTLEVNLAPKDISSALRIDTPLYIDSLVVEQSAAGRIIDTVLTDARVKVQSVQGRINSVISTDSFMPAVEKERAAMRANVERFLKQVEIYLGAVTTMGQSGLVAELGLVKDFSRLTQPMLDPEKEEFVKEVETAIFLDFENFQQAFRLKLRNIDEQLKPLRTELTDISLKNTDIKVAIPSPIFLKNACEQEALDAQRRMFQSVASRTLGVVGDIRAETLALSLRNSDDEAARIKRIALIWSGAVAVEVTMISWAAIATWMSDALRSFPYFNQVLGAALGAVAVGLTTFLVKKMLKERRAVKAGARQNLLQKSRAIAASKLDELQKQVKQEKPNLEAFKQAVLSALKWEVSMALTDVEARGGSDIFARATNLYNAACEQEKRLSDAIAGFGSAVVDHFSSTKAHVEKLLELSARIKASKITPSFELLERTSQTLTEIEQNLTAVRRGPIIVQ